MGDPSGHFAEGSKSLCGALPLPLLGLLCMRASNRRLERVRLPTRGRMDAVVTNCDARHDKETFLAPPHDDPKRAE